MQSHYLLNIAKAHPTRKAFGGGPAYEHFAAVRLPQMKAQEADAIKAAETFAERFPAPAFKLSLTYWEGRGFGVAFEGAEQ